MRARLSKLLTGWLLPKLDEDIHLLFILGLIMYRRISTTGLLPCLAILAACGGGGGSDGGGTAAPEPVAVLDLGSVPPQLADGTPIDPASYVGRSFPMLVAWGTQGSGGFVSARAGEIRVIDATTIEVTLPGFLPKTYTQVSPGRFSDGTTTIDLTDLGGVQLVEGRYRPIDQFAGVFGFQTPEGVLSGTATYDITNSRLFLSTGDEFPLVLSDTGTARPLVADFGARTISGRLFDVSLLQDIDDDGNTDDRLLLSVDLDADIVQGGFQGGVSAAALADIDDIGAPRDLDLQVGFNEAKGTFNGNAGETVAGYYYAQFGFTVPPGFPTSGTTSGTMSGIFVGDKR